MSSDRRYTAYTTMEMKTRTITPILTGFLAACALGGGDLIPHEREQRRNDERRPGVLFAQEFCRDEIDVALAPAGALHDEQWAASFQQMFNRFELSRAERGL